jgi:hypothetical protein
MINVRRLAAVDLSGLGPTLILSEFGLAVVGAPALGVLTLRKSASPSGMAFGVGLIGLGLNYLPLLIHAIDLVRRGTVDAEIADEAGDRAAMFAKYRKQSLWLLLPFVVLIAGLTQAKRR